MSYKPNSAHAADCPYFTDNVCLQTFLWLHIFCWALHSTLLAKGSALTVFAAHHWSLHYTQQLTPVIKHLSENVVQLLTPEP